MPYTPDGFPYDSGTGGDDWTFIREASWQSNKPANNYLAEIGQRNFPGWKGLLQNLAKGPAKWIAVAVSAVVSILPIPGAQVLGPSLAAAVKKGASKEAANLMAKALKEVHNNMGTQGFTSQFKNMVLIDDNTNDTIRGKFAQLDEVARTYTIHHVLNDLIRNYQTVVTGDFNKDEVTRKCFISFLCAVLCFPYHSTHHLFSNCPEGQDFFASDGFAIYASHMTSQDLCNFHNSAQVEKMKTVGLVLGTIMATTDENEYNIFLEDLKNTEKQNQAQKAGIDWGKWGGVATVFGFVGLIFSKMRS